MQYTLGASLASYSPGCVCVDWSCGCLSGVCVSPECGPLQKHLTVRRVGVACSHGSLHRGKIQPKDAKIGPGSQGRHAEGHQGVPSQQASGDNTPYHASCEPTSTCRRCKDVSIRYLPYSVCRGVVGVRPRPCCLRVPMHMAIGCNRLMFEEALTRHAHLAATSSSSVAYRLAGRCDCPPPPNSALEPICSPGSHVFRCVL